MRWWVVGVIGVARHVSAQTTCTNSTTSGAGSAGGNVTTHHCSVITDCCPSSVPVCQGTSCVANCTFPEVRDVRYGTDDQCISLQQGCGDNCVDCDTGGGCLRCRSDPLYKLEAARCVLNCSSGQVGSIQFTPVVNVSCAPPPPPTAGPPSAPPPLTRRPTRTPTRAPSHVPTRSPTSRRPTSLAPTRVPTTAFPTGTRRRTSASKEESPLDDTATVVVIAICAGSVVLLAAFTACYIGKDYCQRKRYRPTTTHATVAINEVNNETFFLDAGGGMPAQRDGGYLETVTDGVSPEPSGGATVAMHLASASDPDACLTGPEATEFFDWLATLRKQRKTFAILHREMKARQQAQATAAERLRFAKPLSNFTRLGELFAQKKGHQTAPPDGMALLDWAQKTVDRFSSGQ